MLFVITVVVVCVGAVLSVAGVYWGAAGTLRNYRSLKSDLQRLDDIARDESIPDEQKSALRHAIRTPHGNYGMVEYFDEHAQLNALTLVAQGLKWPALLAVAGVLLSAAGSVLSLWL
ncbi:hypothetical protein [Streptomyces sp. Tu6071]|uniref:hypothetical protein n=1 Tax=Streptomyces sp. Tu6071 TaxID=355249 RepID=UPI0005BAC872|nr:hypothetical protein [Streptomyces sp. Tu6071]